ncbi:uncharacterized protein LOC109950842 [Prunus persica]|uniref:uncharacterized protein LOC109950842 n=1 Tax=Prunus persica TaxID=3760 RepID=UPI0009ABA5C3|nr:uncharacterized protein LOC109950842 [Prunus persica]
MDDSRVAKCTYGIGTLMLIFTSITTFDWVSNKLCSRFKLKLGYFELRYSFTDCYNCLLESDDHLKIMFMVCRLMKDQLIHIAVRDRAVVNHVQTVNTNINASPFLLEAVPNNDSFAQHEDTCKDSSQTGSIVDSSAASSSCLSMDFDGISSEFGNEYLGKYGSCGGRKYLSTDWEGYISHEGQKFKGGVCEFRDKLAKYSIENGFKMKYLKNEPRCVTVVCAKKESNGCEWHVHAVKSNVNGIFYIKNLNNTHSCNGLIREKRNKAMGSCLVSSIVKDKVRSNPLVRAIELIIDLKENYGLDIPYHVAWYGKESTTKDLHGDEELSYAHLPWYVDVLKASNVGSHCVLDCGEDGSRFQRIFICFKASIVGFRWCRPMLFIDGTFATNKYKGTFLSATAKNGNKEVFAFAFAIVSGETVDNWRSFLQRIFEVLVDEGRLLTFISDRHGAIIDAVRTVFPASAHGFCLYHLKENLEKKYLHSVGSSFKDHILWLFSKLLYAPTVEEYQDTLKKLRDDGGSTIIDKILVDLPIQNFANAFFPGKRYGEVSNALSESFNSWVKDVIEDELENLAAKGRHLRICHASESIFKVHVDFSVMVNLDERFCSCYQWQLLGFPCQHAIQVIQHAGLCLYNFVDEYYKADFYRATYATLIFPIPDIEKPPPGDVFILPPHIRKPPRQAPTKRFKSSSETKRQVKCKRCRSCDLHNRTCKAPI